MLRNYLKIAFRNLRKRLGYTAINVIGLTLGLTCCLLIFQYVAFEYSFDRFHENEDELYRVTQAFARPGESLEAGAYTAYALAPALDDAVPDIRRVTRLHPEYSPAVVANPEHPGRIFEEGEVFYVDPAFLEMFTFSLVMGDRASALEPGTALISESAAEKYFGGENPIGKVLDWTGATQKSYRVSGVFQDVPANSHMQFDFLLPMEDLLRSENYRNGPEGGWSQNNFYTYAQLRPNADRAEVERKMTEVYTAHRGEELREQGFRVRMGAQPLRDVHLNADVHTPAMFVTGSYRTVYFFTVIGLVTLIIALVNYVNLATARALDRAREVGVRKVVGAQRRQLVTQFLFESALTNLVAAALAVVLAALLTPVVNNLAGTHLTGALWVDPWFWLAFLATFGACTLLAGLYPAFVLSSFKPVSVLKGKARSFGSQLWLRRGLVVFQFAASVVLLAGTVVVYNQLHYMRTMDLGLDLEQVLTVQGPRVLPEGADREMAMNTFTQELQRLPNVRQVAMSTSLPGQGFNWNGASVRRAEDAPADAIRGVVTYIDTSFAGLYGLELAAGSGFSETAVPISDTTGAPWSIIANETAVRALDFATPEAAVGRQLKIGDQDARLIGVVRDFNWTSAHEERQNILFGYYPAGRHVSLQVSTEQLPQTIAAVEEIYSTRFPDNPFNYSFVDEQFDQQYRNEQRFARLFTVFAGLAILIACLGLFGLAAYAAQQRTKEIGIRKALGATAPQIVGLLSKDFIQLVLVAFVIAAPVAYWVMQQWLDNFAYRVGLGPWVFLGAGTVAFVIALLTVSTQALRAARTDPTKALRYE